MKTGRPNEITREMITSMRGKYVKDVADKYGVTQAGVRHAVNRFRLFGVLKAKQKRIAWSKEMLLEVVDLGIHGIVEKLGTTEKNLRGAIDRHGVREEFGLGENIPHENKNPYAEKITKPCTHGCGRMVTREVSNLINIKRVRLACPVCLEG